MGALIRFTRVLFHEHFTYFKRVPREEIENQLKDLLTNSSAFRGPNISGDIWGDKFSATHKWTLMTFSGGGMPIYIDGQIGNYQDGYTKISIDIYPNFTTVIISFVFIGLSASFIIAGLFFGTSIQLNDTPTNGVLPGLIFSIPPAVLIIITYFMKTGLRETFESRMEIEPCSY